MATHDQQEMTYIQPQQVVYIYMHGPDTIAVAHDNVINL